MFLFENTGAREPDKVIKKKKQLRGKRKKYKYFPSKRMISQIA